MKITLYTVLVSDTCIVLHVCRLLHTFILTLQQVLTNEFRGRTGIADALVIEGHHTELTASRERTVAGPGQTGAGLRGVLVLDCLPGTLSYSQVNKYYINVCKRQQKCLF